MKEQRWTADPNVVPFTAVCTRCGHRVLHGHGDDMAEHDSRCGVLDGHIESPRPPPGRGGDEVSGEMKDAAVAADRHRLIEENAKLRKLVIDVCDLYDGSNQGVSERIDAIRKSLANPRSDA